jgi:hypothetical protein
MYASEPNYSYILASQDQIILKHNVHDYYHAASLLKLFVANYISYHFRIENETRLIELTNNSHLKSLKPALINSLKDSDNDAFAYLVDLYSESRSGSELAKQELEQVINRRRRINEYYKQELSFSGDLNLINKCFSFDYYGSEAQIAAKAGFNQINTEDVLKLWRHLLSHSAYLLKYMRRDLNAEGYDYQKSHFSLPVLKEKLGVTSYYSKAGWNSKVRHESCMFKYKSNNYFLVILTRGYSKQKNFIANLAADVLAEAKLSSC